MLGPIQPVGITPSRVPTSIEPVPTGNVSSQAPLSLATGSSPRIGGDSLGFMQLQQVLINMMDQLGGSAESQRLMDVTAESLRLGIAAANPGAYTTDISRAIQEYVEAQGYSVVREYTGHGIGRKMHEDPQIPNYFEPRIGGRVRLRPGMTFALEPMVNVGDWRTRVLGDNWTVVTADGTRSAHFEHTVAVTNNGPEILTRP